jgi:hypothetical protein
MMVRKFDTCVLVAQQHDLGTIRVQDRRDSLSASARRFAANAAIGHHERLSRITLQEHLLELVRIRFRAGQHHQRREGYGTFGDAVAERQMDVGALRPGRFADERQRA